MKPETVARRVAEVEKELDHLERGLYAPRGIDWCCDKITWLWKFRYIDEPTMNALCDRACELLEIL